MTEQGVIIITDDKQETFLPWWWKYYSKHSHFPVTFIDIGMSESAKLWCQSKGSVISLPLPKVAEKCDIDPKLASFWEEAYPGPIWKLRPAWFAKPFALLQSPYQYTLYFDIDCAIQKPIEPLFNYAQQGFSLVKHVLDIGTFHNSGVLAFKKEHPALLGWAETCQNESHLHLGDDDALRALIDNQSFPFSFFPIDYNWPDLLDGSEKATVRHYLGPLGKKKIVADV